MDATHLLLGQELSVGWLTARPLYGGDQNCKAPFWTGPWWVQPPYGLNTPKVTTLLVAKPHPRRRSPFWQPKWIWKPGYPRCHCRDPEPWKPRVALMKINNDIHAGFRPQVWHRWNPLIPENEPGFFHHARQRSNPTQSEAPYYGYGPGYGQRCSHQHRQHNWSLWAQCLNRHHHNFLMSAPPHRRRLHEFWRTCRWYRSQPAPHQTKPRQQPYAGNRSNTKSVTTKPLRDRQKAHKRGLTLKQAAMALGYVSDKDFDKWVKAEDMI